MEDGGGEDMNIRVVVRCRPFNSKERNNGETSIVKISDGVITLSNPSGSNGNSADDHSFSFDMVFGPDCLQSEVWEIAGLPILDKAIAGYNGTIFAYGQTGSGKTWSMQGGDDDLKGIIPRMSQSLFDKVAIETQQRPTIKFLITASYFEIYNEVIFDLLDASDRKKKQSNNKAGLEIKEHPALGVYVKGLQEIVVEDGSKLQGIIDQGMRSRTVASTQMNADSSRSHSVFMITVHQKDTDDESRNIFAKINLVDLAGSERVKSTGATGATLKEGANINKSLSALGNVINALVEAGKGKNTFIPYRNSKLTRVLQESLGGNSITTMLAALSPAACNFEETLSTLKYANRAKAIKVKAVKNEEASQVSRLNDEIRLLREKLSQQGDRGDTGGAGGGSEKNQQQLAELEMALKNTWESKAKISKDYELERNRLLQEQQAAAQQLRAAKQRNWMLLEEKGQAELTISHVKEVCKAAVSTPSTSNMEELLDALQRQLLALDTQEKKAQDQQSVCAVFRNALVKDIQALLQIKCTSSDQHNTILISLRQVCNKAQALQEEVQRWSPTVQYASKMLHDLRRSAEALNQRAYGTFGKTKDDVVREDVVRGLWLIVRQLRARESAAADQVLTVNKAVGDAGSVIDGLQNFGTQYEAAVKRDVVSWSNAEDVLKLLNEAVRNLKYLQASITNSNTIKGKDNQIAEETEESLPYQIQDSVHFSVQTVSGSDNDHAESTTIVSNQPVACQSSEHLNGSSGNERTVVLDMQESVVLQGIQLLPTMIVASSTAANQSLGSDSQDHNDHNTDNALERIEEHPETNPTTANRSNVTATAMTLASVKLPCGLSTQNVVDFYQQQLDQPAHNAPDDSAMEAIAKDTAQALSDLLDWTVLLKQHDPVKFLRRPPVRFLFDLFQHLANNYKCCLSPLLVTADWSEVAASRESKTAYMDGVLVALSEEIKQVYTTTSPAAEGKEQEVQLLLAAIQAHSGNNIVAGADTEKTNRILQLIALCTYRRHTLHATTTNSHANQTMTGSESGMLLSHSSATAGAGGAATVAGMSSPGKHNSSSKRSNAPKYLVCVQSARLRVSEDGQTWSEVPAQVIAQPKDVLLLSCQSSHAIVRGRFVSLTVGNFTSESLDNADISRSGDQLLAIRPRVVGTPASVIGEKSLVARNHLLSSSQNTWQRISETCSVWTNVAALTVQSDQQERSKRLDEARRKMEKEAAEQTQRAQSLASEKDALQSSNADLAAQLQQMVTQLLAAQQAMGELQQNVQRLEESSSHLQEQVAQRDQQCAALETQRMLLETSLEKEKAAVGQLQSDLYDKEQALETALFQLQVAHKRYDDLDAEKEELQQAMQVLQEERDTARQHEEEFFERLGDVTADLERLQESYVDICDRCNDAQDEASELRDKVESLQETLRVLSQTNNNQNKASNGNNNNNGSHNQGNTNSNTNSNKGGNSSRYHSENGYDEDDNYYDQPPSPVVSAPSAMSMSKSESSSPQKKASKKSSGGGGGGGSGGQPPSSSSSVNGRLQSIDDSDMLAAGAKTSSHNNGSYSHQSGSLSARSGGAGDEDDYQEDFDDL